MLKSITLALVLGSTIVGLSAVPADARVRNTAAQCQAIYELTLNDPKSYRQNRDDYIACVGNL
jgi:hypothetical protein